MNTPNLRLMRAYGNEAVFFQKTASEPPLARRAALLAQARAEMEHLEELKTTSMHLEAQRMNARARLMELAKMERTINNAHHTRSPITISGGPDLPAEDMPFGLPDYGPAAAGLPVGMTEGMIRMASVIGADMAKMANPYREPAGAVEEAAPAVAGKVGKSSTWQKFVDTKGGLAGKTFGVSNAIVKPLALAGAAGTLYAGSKVLKRGLHWLGQEPGTPTYNAGGNQLASDVNEHGQAQLRLPSSYY